MMERFTEDAKNLSSVLKDLLTRDVKDDQDCCAAVFEPNEDEKDPDHLYQITFVPPNTKHLLQHIASRSSIGFFLLGKASLLSVYNEECEEELQLTITELSRHRTERVLVGTPISQEVVFINGREPLHQGITGPSSGRNTSSQSKSCVYEWCLANAMSLESVSLSKARYIVSLFDYSLANGFFVAGREVPPLWISVDEKNPRSVTHMATLPAMGSEVMKTNHVITVCKGPFNKPETIPNMSSMKKWHNTKSIGAIVENNSYAYALYELLGISHYQEMEQEDPKSSAYVEFTWGDISSVLQPPPLTSDCVLHIQSFPGTMQLTALALSLEVNRLCSLVTLIEEPDHPWPELASDEVDSIKDVYSRMEKFLENLNAGEAYSQINAEHDDENDKSDMVSPLKPLIHQSFVARKDLDFTEHLWLVLKDAVSLEDLSASLQVALFALLNGTCQPVIHSANMTTLAVFIRELLQSETNEQRHKLRLKVEKMLDNKLALKCLIEIGMEKLLRDHTDYFLSEELVTRDQLSYYIENKVPLKERVSRVSRLHNVLEVVLTTKCIINAGDTNLQQLTQAALSYYENHSTTDHPVFSISLPAYGASSTSAVKNIITTQQPSVWSLSLTSKSKKGELTSIVQLSTEPPVKKMSGFLEDSQLDGEVDLTISGTVKNRIPYYLSHVQQTMIPLVAQKK